MALDMEKLKRFKAGEMGGGEGGPGSLDAAEPAAEDGMTLISEIEERLAKLKKLYGEPATAEDPV